MSSVVNKPSPTGDPAFPDFYVQLSANTPDFPTAQWVRNSPNLAALIGAGTPENPDVPKRYWIVDPIGSQNLREMTAPEQAAVDGSAPELAAARASKTRELQLLAVGYLTSRYTSELQLMFQQLWVSANGPALVALNGWFAWVETIYAAVATAQATADVAATVPLVEAVSVNFSVFDGTDPLTTLQDVTP